MAALAGMLAVCKPLHTLADQLPQQCTYAGLVCEHNDAVTCSWARLHHMLQTLSLWLCWLPRWIAPIISDRPTLNIKLEYHLVGSPPKMACFEFGIQLCTELSMVAAHGERTFQMWGRTGERGIVEQALVS